MINIDLTGKRALVTGANSGIGEAVVDALSDAGADVAVNYISHPDAADAVVERVKAKGSRSVAIQADVSDETQVAGMFEKMDSALGGIDILVNNAGIDGKAGRAWELDTAHWKRVLDINLTGAFLMSHEALRRMVEQKSGVIINMTSVHEMIPWSGYAAYTASKAGLSMMTKTLAQEAAPFGVRVLSVAPGAIKTPINKSVWNDPEGLADLNQKIPMGRMGERAEIAGMVAVLASNVASYATGSSIFIDGGMTDFADFSHGG